MVKYRTKKIILLGQILYRSLESKLWTLLKIMKNRKPNFPLHGTCVVNNFDDVYADANF